MDVADHFALKRRDQYTDVPVGVGILLLEAFRDRRHLGLRASHADITSDERDGDEIVASPLLPRAVPGFVSREPDISVHWVIEGWRQHADDGN